MENTQNNMMGPSSSDNKKPVLFTVMAGVVVLGVLIWWTRMAPISQQVGVSPTPDTEATTIGKDVDSIDVGDLNAEFNAIDKDLQSL